MQTATYGSEFYHIQTNIPVLQRFYLYQALSKYYLIFYFLLVSLLTVSYTHLDVYKRQVPTKYTDAIRIARVYLFVAFTIFNNTEIFVSKF